MNRQEINPKKNIKKKVFELIADSARVVSLTNGVKKKRRNTYLFRAKHLSNPKLLNGDDKLIEYIIALQTSEL